MSQRAAFGKSQKPPKTLRILSRRIFLLWQVVGLCWLLSLVGVEGLRVGYAKENNAKAPSADINPLLPVARDTPRETFESYYSAMRAYHAAKKRNDHSLAQSQLERAVQTLDLSAIPPLLQREKGRDAAVYLKEILDRIVIVDTALIPNLPDVDRWRVPKTNLTIHKTLTKDDGEVYLFSPKTVEQVPLYFELVEDRPYLKGSDGGAAYKAPWIERKIPAWTRQKTVGLYRWQWVGIFLAILLGFFAKGLAHTALKQVRHITKRTRMEWDDQVLTALERPLGLVVLAMFWFFCLSLLSLDGQASTLLTLALQIMLSIGLIWGVYQLTHVLGDHLSKWALRSDSQIDDQLVPLMTRAMRVFILLFGVLLAIQNLGINVMSLLAGLGLGGLAFALAAKDTAANLFGSIMILWDKPFKVGDWVVISAAEGTVEEIGFRSTRMRTFYNSVVVVPNSEMANAHIDNMGQRRYRRVKATLGMTYGTPAESLQRFVDGIKEIIRTDPATRKDYFHVVFNDYGSSSLNVLVYFFLDVPDWGEELASRERIFFAILGLARDLKVDFAFPTQSIYLENLPDKPME